VHSGFLDSAKKESSPELDSWIDELQKKRIVFCGHSLGVAIDSLCGVRHMSAVSYKCVIRKTYSR